MGGKLDLVWLQRPRMNNAEARLDELLALQAIYDSLQHETNEGSLTICIPIQIELEGSRECVVHDATGQISRLQITYLPPITAKFRCPASYPYDAPPELELSAIWQQDNQECLNRIRVDALQLWDHEPVIWAIIDHVSHLLDDATEPLNIVTGSEKSPLPLNNALNSYNAKLQRSTFAASTFACSICLSQCKGKRCFRLESCAHVFCSACLSAFFALCIQEGVVRRVCCPDPECTEARQKAEKEDSAKAKLNNGKQKEGADRLPGHVERDELLEIVGAELLERYDWLIEKQRVEADPRIVFCPRCSAPVEPPDYLDGDISNAQAAGAAKLRTCEKCTLSFCFICKKTWHGSQTPCRVTHAQDLVQRYLDATEDEKSKLEFQYGANVIKRLVSQYQEDQANDQWKSDNSMPCPDCHIHVEKSYGCSHMTCSRCNCHFCFRCGARLKANDPYLHFNSAGSCYQRLFDYQPSDNEAMEAANWEAIGQILDEGLEQ